MKHFEGESSFEIYKERAFIVDFLNLAVAKNKKCSLFWLVIVILR